MARFGADFQTAKTQWLYPVEPQQYFWRGLGLFALIAVINLIAQIVGASGAYSILFGHRVIEFFNPLESNAADIMKASIVGLTPAAIVVIGFCYFLMPFGMPGRKGRLPLAMPNLGWLGWAIILIGFVVLMIVLFQAIFAILGIDPESYSPIGGLDGKSSSGLVEKTMADLAKQPFLFALALPGAIIAAPMTEELIFRGFLFSALVNTPVGRWGAVIITSALWAAMHLSGAPMLFVGIIFIMGLLLGLLLLRFGSLWVPIICHGLWNLVTSLSILGVGMNS